MKLQPFSLTLKKITDKSHINLGEMILICNQ